jgi:hypothetical protein
MVMECNIQGVEMRRKEGGEDQPGENSIFTKLQKNRLVTGKRN